MFEYLMPLLVMPSLCRKHVARPFLQIRRGPANSIWQSNRRSLGNFRIRLQFTRCRRQLSVSRLWRARAQASKRGLAHDVVIAPYATVIGFNGRAGQKRKTSKRCATKRPGANSVSIEALDYTRHPMPNRPDSPSSARSWRTIKGRGLPALTYLLLDRPMQRRFNANPLFKSAELAAARTRPARNFPCSIRNATGSQPPARHTRTIRPKRRCACSPIRMSGRRKSILLSNGPLSCHGPRIRGSGYSPWNDTALTRWRKTPLSDARGAAPWHLLRDVENGAFWSPTASTGTQSRSRLRSHLQPGPRRVPLAVVWSIPMWKLRFRRRMTSKSAGSPSPIIPMKRAPSRLPAMREIVLNSAGADLAPSRLQQSLHPDANYSAAECHSLFTPANALPNEKLPWIGHHYWFTVTRSEPPPFETDPAQIHWPRRKSRFARRVEKCLAAHVRIVKGPCLDPIAAIRRTLRLEPKESATVTLRFPTHRPNPRRDSGPRRKISGPDHRRPYCFFELAWTHGLIMLRHLNTTEVRSPTLWAPRQRPAL